MTLIAHAIGYAAGAFVGTVRAIYGGITDRINSEPVLVLGLVNASILLGVGFGLNWTRDQVVLVGTFASALLAFLARREVTPA